MNLDTATTIITQDLGGRYISSHSYYDDEYGKEDSIFEYFYISEKIDVDLNVLIENHVSDNSEVFPYWVTEIFLNLYNDSDEIQFLPVYGKYLENTALYICVFYKNGTAIGAKCIYCEAQSKIVELSVLRGNIDGHNQYDDSYSDERCFTAILPYLAYNQFYELQGVIYGEVIGANIYPVGKRLSDGVIMLYGAEEWRYFRNIKPFYSIESGRLLFEDYFDKRKEVSSDIPIYKWETKSIGLYGTVSVFKSRDIEFMEKNLGRTKESFSYLNDYDYIVSVPLLDKNGNEGMYYLHLMYKIQGHYNEHCLIGELILCEKNVDQNKVLFPVKELIAYKDPQTDAYIPFIKPEYVYTVESLISAPTWTSENKIVKGIGFDGENYILICE